jgi:FAD/FMN-containing dehydrogenase
MLKKITSWGNYPKIDSNIFNFRNINELKNLLLSIDNVIAYGNGRSYGDSALNKNIVDFRKWNKFLNFDELNGTIQIQSGVLLSEILEVVVPKGWFLSATPGTKLVTVGGAIASDVHGKNHHINGTFSESIINMKIMLADGSIVETKFGDDIFHLTCGGMGLTGFILEAKLQLKKITSSTISQITIKTDNLDESLYYFEKYKDYPYSVAWIDCLAKNEHLGRTLLMIGDFKKNNNFSYKNSQKIYIPFYFPNWILNNFTVSIFNKLYYYRVRSRESQKDVTIDQFFYPLDSINNWNRVYGRNGFTQYQFILPKENSKAGLREILQQIAYSGMGSFLAVLKLYGKSNSNYISFPIEGYSLALDFKIEPKLFELLNKLDDVVLKYGGRIYLTKDSRVSEKSFKSGYKNIDKFIEWRKNSGAINKFQSLQSWRLKI